MKHTEIYFFKEADNSVPLLEWLASIPEKVRLKCLVRLERLEEKGHDLHRPEADYLRDGIYELRIRHQNVNYRMLYFFNGSHVSVVSHGLSKEKRVPPKEIGLAIERKQKILKNPEHYLFNPEEI